jgi:ParB-like chromosome segregation protein Spo0J
MTTLKWIPVSAVVDTVLQPRLQEDRGLDSLTESILQGGMDTPIIALRAPRTKTNKKTNKKTKLDPDQLYLMRSGHRRRAALLTLVKRGVAELPAGFARIEGGEAHVQAVIVDNVTDEEAAIAALIDNVEREPLTPYEQACALKKLAEERKIDRDDLARRVGIHSDTVDYMIAALDPRNLPPKMIQSWKQGQLVMGHVQALIRLRGYKQRQKQLYTKIIKERLSVTEARFWCTRLLDKGDIPLERRTNVLMAERFLGSPKLKALIDSKQLNVRPSVHGDQVTIKVDGTREMREACLAIAAALKGLDL